MLENRFVVEGFEFTNEQEVNVAKSELRGINYIVSRTDMNNPKSLLVLYNKIIEKNLLKTPIGVKFLKEIQDMLLSSNEIDETLIKPIPTVLGAESSKAELLYKNKAERSKKRSPYKKIMINSIVINIILIIVILFMFIITGNSNNLNIINYENRIKDQYSSWEEELSQQESSLDQRESIMDSQN